MKIILSAEQVYLLRELIYEEMDRLGGYDNLPPELAQIAKELVK